MKAKTLGIHAGLTVSLALALGAGTAAAQAGAELPSVLFHVEHFTKHGNSSELATYGYATKVAKALYTGLQSSFTSAVHPGTGRFALAMSTVGTETWDETLGDRKVTLGPAVPMQLVIGSVGKGIETVFTGDAGCIPARCFEAAWSFSADGSRLYTQLVASGYTLVRSIPVAAPAAAALVFDKRKSKRTAGPPAMSPDQKRIAYPGTNELYVEAMPAVPVDARKKPKLSKQSKAVAKPNLLMDAAVGVMDDVIFFHRREPKEQKEGYIEAYDVKQKKTTRVYTFAQEFPFWGGVFLGSIPSRTVVFRAERKLLAVSLDDMTTRTLAEDVNELFDVSVDGRHALVETSAIRTPDSRESDTKNPLKLTLYEIASGKKVAEYVVPIPADQSLRIEEAHLF